MMAIAKIEIKLLIAEVADRNYTERTQAEFQTHTEEAFVDMLHLGNIAASNGIRTGLPDSWKR